MSVQLEALSIVIVGGDGEDSFERVLMQADTCGPSSKQNPNELLQLMYTSGTTGEPKGAMHSSNTLYANVVPFAQRLKITDKMWSSAQLHWRTSWVISTPC